MYHQHFKVCYRINSSKTYVNNPLPFIAEVQHHGSLFTLFLHSPLTALYYICNVGDVPIHHWGEVESHWAATKNYRLAEVTNALSTTAILEKWKQYKKPMGFKLVGSFDILSFFVSYYLTYIYLF